MKNNSQILSFFVTSSVDRQESLLSNVIEESYRIAYKYLQFNQMKISKRVLKGEMTIQELAIDCVAGLFVRRGTNEQILIQQTFSNWEPPITSEDECIFFLNKVVANRVEQHIYQLLKEEDPLFPKILNSINYLVRINGYYKIHFLGKTFLTESDLIKFEKCFISTDEFEKIPLELFKEKRSILKNLFNYLKNETDFNVAIPFNDLILRLKQVNFSDYLMYESSNSEFKKIELNEFLEKGYQSALDRLTHSYVDKGKLNEFEKKAFQSALNDMVIDLGDGGINPGLYKYLSAYIPGLTEDKYQLKYHNILEYLLKVMKNNIAAELSENN